MLIENNIQLHESQEHNLVEVINQFEIWNEDRVIKKLKTIVSKIGVFPTKYKLLKLNEHGLIYAIEKYGGYCYFAKLFGIQKRYKYWSEEKIVKEIKQLIADIGYFPAEKKMMALANKKYLANAIKEYGGFKYFRNVIKQA